MNDTELVNRGEMSVFRSWCEMGGKDVNVCVDLKARHPFIKRGGRDSIVDWRCGGS